jgi:GNAT superfamily N-acetyltransferase
VIAQSCDMCGAPLEAADLDAYGDVFLAHVRADHADLPYPDVAIRNYGAGLARMTGSTERLPAVGEVEIHPVTEDRIDDWLDLFDHRVFAGFPQWSACYCTEPHFLTGDPGSNMRPWDEKRTQMIGNLRSGATFGYLAYVDGEAAGWVNASKRCDYSLFRRDDEDDATTVGVSCFAIAPPYRGHGIAKRLLDRVVADAAERGATWVEAYPFNEGRGNDNPDFRGPRSIYDERGFTEVKVRQRDTVVRRTVS